MRKMRRYRDYLIEKLSDRERAISYLQTALVEYEKDLDGAALYYGFSAAVEAQGGVQKFALKTHSTPQAVSDALLSKDETQIAELLKKQVLANRGMDKNIVQNGPLPKGWREVKLKEVANLRKGKYQPSDSQPVRCIELEHLEKNSGRIIGEIDARTQNSTKNIFKAGDVLFGKLRPYLRKFGLPKFNGVCSSEIWVFVSNTDLITNKYLFYSLQTECFINSACKTTGTKMPRADWNFVQNVPVALPPLSEQKAIASLLEKWDTAIEKTEALIEAKEKRFKWLLKTLISDQQDNPEWQKMKLGEICTFEYGKPLKEQDRIGDRYPVFGSNGIVGSHNEYLVAGPFIVVGRKGSAGTVLYSVNNGFPIDTTFYINLQSEEIQLRFLYYLLLLVELDRISAQSGVPGLNRNDAYKISISIPSSVEQKVITRILDAGNREIDLLKQLAEQYRTQKRGLMQKLLTGEWRVSNQ